jgi:uncharacterized membrane protein
MISGVSTTTIGLALAIFLACAVEAVEALTVVLAVGTARGWRWTLAGAARGSASRGPVGTPS